MQFFKYILISLGLMVIVLSIINSVYDNSIFTNMWSFGLGVVLIWLALDKTFQKKFEKFLS